jgi:hypothetical protein
VARGVEWGLSTKMDAACAYAGTGDVNETARLCNVAPRTIRTWLGTDWFCELLKEVRLDKQDELDGKWTNIIHLATEKLKERLVEGDPVVDPKTKEVKYVPVKVKDLSWMIGLITDKRSHMRARMPNQAPANEATDRHLNQIADALAGKIITEDEAEQA